MERRRSSNELHNLIEAIKSSEVVENRVEMLTQLRDLDLSENSDLNYLIQCLTTFWEDFTCLDVSQCMLNKTILHVAAKYVDSDLSGCLLQFLQLGVKAWLLCVCVYVLGERLVWKASEDDSHVERGVSRGRTLQPLFSDVVMYVHTFYPFVNWKLLMDFLSFSAASFLALTRYPVSNNEESMSIVEKFTLEQLNLTKDAISDSKAISSAGLDILKVAQAVIDVVIRLCKDYSIVVNWESCDARYEKNKIGIDCEEHVIVNHVANITKCAIEKLSELGVLAANGGGSLVTILNVSWKGVVNLLQLGKGELAVKVNVADIIVTLISLANESLRCGVEAWSSAQKEAISVNEARRTFVPVKFYLINVVKISSQFPSQAVMVYKEITLCVLIISTLRISLSHEKSLKAASEVLVELLEKSSLELLNSLLNSDLVRQELKFEMLNWLFAEECCSNSIQGDPSNRTASIDEIFSVSCEAMPGGKVLLPGRVALFLSFLMYSPDLEEDVKLAITRKLGWFLDTLTDEDLYSSILVSQIPVLYSSGKTLELVWEPLFSALLHGLKTFMIVLSSCQAWEELMSFLLDNFFHPHFLCWEIVMELWCFLVCHVEMDSVNDIIDKLCVMMKSLVSSESVFVPGSAVRKMARSICILLTHCRQSVVDQVYNIVVGDDNSQSSSIMYVALLLEGFPMDSLSDNLRNFAKQKIITDYFSFIESIDDKSISAPRFGAFGVPVFALSASLQSLQINISDIDMKTLKFLVATIRRYRHQADKLMKDHYRKLLSETLGIISNMKHLYTSDEMDEVIFELQDLFISGSAVSDVQFYQCKAELALFLTGIANIKMSESDDCAKSVAVWELYHMALRERHWALVHLALAAFGYFASRTNCTQLWKFVPQDAALSYDLVSGNEPNEGRFMSEFKVFLDKELALVTVAHSSEQLELLVKEGLMLREITQKVSNVKLEPTGCMETDGEIQCNKRRKLPDGISKGVELLQDGLKVIGDGISQWQQNQSDSIELQDKFLTQLSCLEDVISQIVGMTNSG
ncbi:hypothetical protein EZV62_001087 [Acer yangbiense]|uniref:Uncharacterized protein n=1 Tax=Acer yangbiense TaxID=1000413 RepID=A0A5C7ITT1_9ROSI|nr:hypothetical protein EZV62_001087 [Acer yangbiense]